MAQILDTKDSTELAAFAAIRVNASIDVFVEKFRAITTFKEGKEVLQIGKFGSLPRPEDLEALSLTEEEILSLRNCRVGSCEMKMSADMIERLRNEVNWSAPGYRQQVTRLYREMLLEYVKRYLSRGNTALVTYTDKEQSISLAEEFRSLLQNSPFLEECAPALRKRLLNFPGARLPEAEEFIYWSKEKFGPKPVVSMTHITIIKQADATQRYALIASKQIYANHYFKTSLGLTALISLDVKPGAAGAHLIYLNRSRVDLMGGFFAFLKRWIVNRRLRQGMRENLPRVKRKIEADYAP